MSHNPLAAANAQFLDLAITTTDEDKVIDHFKRHQAVTGKWHGCSIDSVIYAEDADLTTSGTEKQGVSLCVGESVLTVKTCIRELASPWFQVVLHRGKVEFERINVNIGLVGSDDHIGWMLRVLVCKDISPAYNTQGEFIDSGVDS